MLRILRASAAVLSVVAALAFLVGEADARAGGGASFGSRGARTFSAPPSTRTAPSASPIQRSITQPSSPNVRTPSTASSGGLFGRPGLLGGLAAGFLGAGLFGLLFGHGLFGGLGGFASLIGLLIQIGLVVVVARLVWAWWQRRNQPAFAGGPMLRDIGANGRGPDASGAGGSASAARGTAGLTAADFDTFERLLGDIQRAYAAEDLNALRAYVTPEMLSYFSEELSQNASRGVVNQISDVKLLQGDLAESWREGGVDYATVAMRFSLVDRLVERATGRLVEGSNAPQEATELWTFMRARGGDWLLSAIQQA
ncbi:MAG TPA: TIM44-like domain-containing protein [Xanthobacteraceae bacterium]|nr:TIM44-like domain-containing protein [Xanthobacteraceae bacterium]